MFAYRLWKALHSLEHRAFLLFEASRLKRLGVELPPGYLWDIWKRPSAIEDFIHIKAFSGDAVSKRVCLVDVGANIGDFSLDFLSYFKGAKIIAFEPDPRNCGILRQEFADSSDFTLFGCALSDAAGQAAFSLSENTKYSSLERYNNDEVEYRNDVQLEQIKVDLARFDALGIELDDTFNILKIDVQGHEVSTIRGFGSELKKFCICLVESSFAEEYVGQVPSFSDITKLMKENNLYPIVFQRFGRAHNSYGYERDVLFVRREMLKNAYWAPTN